MSETSMQVFELPNRARLVLDPLPHLRSAAVGVWLGAGARNDPDGLAGVAHFFEHMAFKGAAGRGPREIAETVEALGASINAATEYERTSYFVRCLGRDAASLLDIVLSLPLQADLPLSEIDRERSVVVQEIGEAADDPEDLVFELAQEAAYPDHVLGRPILGTEASLAGIGRDQLAAFAEANYTPGETVVAVSGAFDAAEVEAVWRLALEGRTGERAAAVRPAPTFAPALRSIIRKAEQCHIVFSREGLSVRDEDRFAARLFVEILGGGMASRLFQEVREARGLAYTIDASLESGSDAGRLQIYAGCAAKDSGEVAELSRDIFTRLAEDGPTDAELARAKTVFEAQIAMSEESPAVRASRAAHDLLTFGVVQSLSSISERLQSVTPDDIRRVGSRALVPGMVTACVGPAAGVRQLERFAT